jgi:NADH dehydrogenase
MQQGRYVAKVVVERLRGRTSAPFRYHDKGNLATIGRRSAVADIRGLKLSGSIAWATWLLVHLWYLVGFQNRVLVFIRWSFSFFSHGRGSRLITGEGTEATSASDGEAASGPGGEAAAAPNRRASA